jgi:WD40 repeat protein
MINRFDRSLLTLLLTIAASIPAVGQRLVIAGIDTSAFPTIRARIYPLDAAGMPIGGLSASDFKVAENGATLPADALSCPSSRLIDGISSVLTIDVSGSMAGSPGGSAPNIALARSAAGAWVDGLPEGRSECAISTFDDRSAVNQDFTRDRGKLRSAIAAIAPKGGTDYDAGLIDSLAGGLSIAAAGREKRIVVFLTDGRGGGNEERIIAAARRIDAQIFCVTLGMPAPDILKKVAEGTGGQWFENVTTVDEAVAVYRAILYRARGGEPCELTWRSGAGCEVERALSIAIPSRSLTAGTRYTAPISSITGIRVDPPSLAFGAVAPGSSKEMQVTLTGVGQSVTVATIEQVGSGGAFSLVDPPKGFTLAPGEKRTLTVRYTPAGSGYTFMRWAMRGDACAPSAIFASGSSGAGNERAIRLIRPNGGERFVPGEETLLGWEGVAPADTVRLDYSTDNGATWRPIADAVSGGVYRWKVPGTPSDRCLARVAQSDTASPATATGQRAKPKSDAFIFVSTASFDRDGSRVVGASWDGTAKILDGHTGREITTIVTSRPAEGKEATRLRYAEFTPDGSRLLTANDDSKVQLWDIASGRLLRSFDGRPNNKPEGINGDDGELLPDRLFTPDGSRILLNNDYNIPTVWDANSGRKVAEIKGHRGWINSAILSPDGRYVLTAGEDSTARIWDATTGRELRSLTGHEMEVKEAIFSPDGKLVATSSFEREKMPNGATHIHGAVFIWDAASGRVVRKLRVTRPGNGASVRALFSPDGTSILLWSTRGGVPTLYDLASGAAIRTFPKQNRNGIPGYEMADYGTFSPDGARVAFVTAGVYDGTADVWDVASGRLLRRCEISTPTAYATFSPDGSRIAGTSGNELKLWEVDGTPSLEDRSDATWAILDSRPASIDLDFGKRLVGREADSVVAGFIRNEGSAPLRVEGITIAGEDASEFRLVSGIPPFDIPAGGAHPVEFSFRPGAAGARTASAEITAGGRAVRSGLRGEGITPLLRLDRETVDFGETPLGDSTAVAVVLSNAGTAPVRVRAITIAGPGREEFGSDAAPGEFTLGAGERRSIALRFHPAEGGRTSGDLAITHDGPGGTLVARLQGRGLGPDELLADGDHTDPTTFRNIVVPNAIVPPRGSVVLGSYDALGLMAGYVPIDNLMILAGGSIPLPDDWGGVKGSMYASYSIGAKYGVKVGEKIGVAVGYQWGSSIYDQDVTADRLESRITFSAPYGALSYGTDDARGSITAGYAFKHHTTIAAGEFDRNALVLALGGDYRIGRSWKIAAEGIMMETLDYAPIAVTARWFGERYALEFGLGYLGVTIGSGKAPSFPLAPVVSYLVVL